MKNILNAVLLMAMLSIVPTHYSLAGEGDYIGQIDIFAGDYAPRYYAFCEGQTLSVKENTALFAIIGNRYGGDGRTTFALPNLKEAEKSLNGARYIIRLVGFFPPRN